MIERPITGLIVRLYRAKHSLRAIAAQLHTSSTTIRRRLVAAHVPLRSRGGPNHRAKAR